MAPSRASSPSASSNAIRTSSSTPCSTSLLGTPIRAAPIGPSSVENEGTGRSADVASAGSRPAMTCSSRAASSTVRASGPILVERGSEGEQAVAGHAAVGRLQPDDAAERCGLANRPAGVGAERQRHHACRHGGRRSAARPARRAILRPGIARRAECRVLRRGAHRELVAVGLADDDRAGGVEPGDDGGVVRRDEVLEHARRGGRHEPARADVVLHRDRHAEERQVRQLGAAEIELGGARPRPRLRHAGETR